MNKEKQQLKNLKALIPKIDKIIEFADDELTKKEGEDLYLRVNLAIAKLQLKKKKK